MTIGDKMTITTWRARQLAYLEEMYAPHEHMGKLMSHLGTRHVYIQLYNQMRTAALQYAGAAEQLRRYGGLPQAARGYVHARRYA